ncbi:hypothetical protein FC96_GL002389 [Secundilactobacillus kimchicus JCM 15530]|uniref:Uncharacterized protein n=1 Tax=Secundilactobacillus kimchicus JCM 15530 TaxID=1302272 RepID=A0A0R1HM66_9LACO|nr:hypothetical protein FC96_GL002389 [Secundilactobacillus kimchicus JCM 15530]
MPPIPPERTAAIKTVTSPMINQTMRLIANGTTTNTKVLMVSKITKPMFNREPPIRSNPANHENGLRLRASTITSTPMIKAAMTGMASKPITAMAVIAWNNAFNGLIQLTNEPMKNKIANGTLMRPKPKNKIGLVTAVYAEITKPTASAIGFTAKTNKIGAKNQISSAESKKPKINSGIAKSNTPMMIGNAIGRRFNIAIPKAMAPKIRAITIGIINNAAARPSKINGKSTAPIANNGNKISGNTRPNNPPSKLARVFKPSSVTNETPKAKAKAPNRLPNIPSKANGNPIKSDTKPSGTVIRFKPGINAVNRPIKIAGTITSANKPKNSGKPPNNSVAKNAKPPMSSEGKILSKNAFNKCNGINKIPSTGTASVTTSSTSLATQPNNKPRINAPAMVAIPASRPPPIAKIQSKRTGTNI